jgi:hypothetical protein
MATNAVCQNQQVTKLVNPSTARCFFSRQRSSVKQPSCIRQQDFLISIDLSYAFSHILVPRALRRYLRIAGMDTPTTLEPLCIIFPQLLAVPKSDESFRYERDHREYEHQIVKAIE